MTLTLTSGLISRFFVLYYSYLSSNVSYARPIPLGAFVTCCDISCYLLIFYEASLTKNFLEYCGALSVKVRKEAKIRNQYNQVPYLTLYGKVTKNKKTSNNTREPRGQPFPSRWPQGCKKQTRQYGIDKKNYKKDPQKKHCLGMVSKKITGGLKQ